MQKFVNEAQKVQNHKPQEKYRVNHVRRNTSDFDSRNDQIDASVQDKIQMLFSQIQQYQQYQKNISILSQQIKQSSVNLKLEQEKFQKQLNTDRKAFEVWFKNESDSIIPHQNSKQMMKHQQLIQDIQHNNLKFSSEIETLQSYVDSLWQQNKNLENLREYSNLVVSSEVQENKRETKYINNKSVTKYSNGTIKVQYPNEQINFYYYNGDIKKILPQGTEIYLFKEQQIVRRRFPDGTEIIDYPDGSTNL